MKKGAALLGIGIDNVRLVPCDSRGRMDVEALDRLTEQAKAEVRLVLCVCWSLLIFYLHIHWFFLPKRLIRKKG